MITLSKVGMGQILSLGGGAQAAPSVNCERVFFTANNSSASYYDLYYSATGNIGTYTFLGTNAITSSTPFYNSSGYYYTEFLDNLFNPISNTSANPINVLINKVTKGSITGNQTICSGGDPLEFTSTAGTGDGTISYRWEKNTNFPTQVWSNISGVSTETYDVPGGLGIKSQYRRYAISTLSGLSCETSTPSNILTIDIDELPTTSIAGNNEAVCIGLTKTLSANTPSVGSASWSISGAGSNISQLSSQTSPSAVYTPPNSPGIFTLTWTISNGVCPSSNSSFTISINSRPVANITSSSTSICIGQNSILSGTITATGNWSFNLNDGTVVTGSGSGSRSWSVAPTINTSYSISSFTDANCNSISSDLTGNTNINVNPLPTITIGNTENSGSTNNDAIICSGASITLFGLGGISYTWNNGITNNISFSPVSTGTYTVTGTDVNGCQNTNSQVVTVNNLPTIGISKTETSGLANNDAIICNGASITLSGIGGVSYTWNNGITNNISFSPVSTGTYTVTGTDVNGCQNTNTQVVIVNQLPNITATSNPSDGLICAGSNITLNGGGASTYVWSGTVSDGIAFVPTSTTTYTVTGTDGNGCTNTATKTVTVKSLPNTPTSIPRLIVYDGTAHSGIANAGTGESIFWYTAPTGSTISSVPTQTNVGKKESYAEAKLDAAPFCISASRANVSIEITPAPLTIKNITGANKVYDGTTNASINGAAAYDGLVAADAGLATVQGGPSFNFDTKDVGVNKPISVTGYVAPSTNYTFTQPTGLTASISPAPLTISGITGVPKIYDRTTNATVTGTPVYNGLVAGESLSVVGSPMYTFADKNVGTSKPISVSGFTAPNVNYTLSSQPTGIIADITPKLLTVTGTIPNRVYDATTSTPGLVLNNDRIAGDIVNVSRSSAAFDNPNAGVNKNIQLLGVNIIPGDDGANYYLASPNVTIQGTITPLPININANDAIKTELDPDPVFTYTHSPALYAPDVFTGSLSRIAGEAPADYPLTIGSLSAGGNYTLNLNSAKLTIKPLVTNYIFEVPNAFTPNLDGTNDLLTIIKNYRVTGLNYFRIYNRTGQLVFETNNVAQGWNGRRMGDMSGNVLESDLYVWIAEFTTMNDPGRPVKKTGSVLLLK